MSTASQNELFAASAQTPTGQNPRWQAFANVDIVQENATWFLPT
jgi:hypothetical protein